MDALYFPYLSLPGSTWVNPALLYFDRLCLIAPEGDRPNLFDDRTRQLIDLRLARPLVPRQGHDTSDERFIAYVLGQASTKKRFGRLARVHFGKLAHTHIPRALIGAELLRLVDGTWLEGPEWVVAQIMAFLALQISSHSRQPLPLITDELAAARIASGPYDRRTTSRRVRAIARLLPVPAEAAPTEIGRFRRRHTRELHAFRDYVDELITQDELSDYGESSFQERLGEAERLRDHLVGEMQEFSWRNQATTIGIAAATAAASLIEQSPYSFGAGLVGVAYSGTQGFSAWRRQRAASRSPLIYATNVVSRWTPTASQTLQ